MIAQYIGLLESAGKGYHVSVQFERLEGNWKTSTARLTCNLRAGYTPGDVVLAIGGRGKTVELVSRLLCLREVESSAAAHQDKSSTGTTAHLIKGTKRLIGPSEPSGRRFEYVQANLSDTFRLPKGLLYLKASDLGPKGELSVPAAAPAPGRPPGAPVRVTPAQVPAVAAVPSPETVSLRSRVERLDKELNDSKAANAGLQLRASTLGQEQLKATKDLAAVQARVQELERHLAQTKDAAVSDRTRAEAAEKRRAEAQSEADAARTDAERLRARFATPESERYRSAQLLGWSTQPAPGTSTPHRALEEALARRGLGTAGAAKLSAALLVGQVPIVAGPWARLALETLARVWFGGRIVVIRVSPTTLDFADLFRKGDGLPGALFEAALTTTAETRRPALLVLDGVNRAPTESYLTPLLQCRATRARGSQAPPFVLPAELRDGASRSWEWPPLLHLAATLAAGPTTLPLSPDLWAGAIAVEILRHGPDGGEPPASEAQGFEPPRASSPPSPAPNLPGLAHVKDAARRFAEALGTLEADEKKRTEALVESLYGPALVTLDGRSGAPAHFQKLRAAGMKVEPELEARLIRVFG